VERALDEATQKKETKRPNGCSEMGVLGMLLEGLICVRALKHEGGRLTNMARDNKQPIKGLLHSFVSTKGQKDLSV
jgi:hypothetical protein